MKRSEASNYDLRGIKCLTSTYQNYKKIPKKYQFNVFFNKKQFEPQNKHSFKILKIL
jgi:hypothetical protein